MSTDAKTLAADMLPPDPPGFRKWVRDNFFSNWFNTFLTVIILPASAVVIYYALRWVFVDADWSPVTTSPLLYILGQYPRAEMWRLAASLSGVMLMIGISWGKWGGIMKTIAIPAVLIFGLLFALPIQHRELEFLLYTISDFEITLKLYLGITAGLIALGYLVGRQRAVKGSYVIVSWVITPLLILALASGFGDSELLPAISTTIWGGLFVTFFLAVGGILLSFPIGVALALGRRSTLPVLKVFSTVVIETIRGMPLVTILFMFSFILNYLVPEQAIPDRLMRALLALTLFSAAYTAENIRGGLAAVAPGQVEAAKSLGMSGWKITLFIELPQAIRAILPAIVGQFIALFKDTTLVVVIGINDFLGIGRSIIKSSPEFLQLQLEVYVFIAAVYMIFSYLMSMASRRLETTLGVQHG